MNPGTLTIKDDVMTEWDRLAHAYGNASDVPALLDALVPDPEAAVWGELYSRVCHQGTIYSASYPVLPFLLRVASTWLPGERIMPLHLAGAIATAYDTVGVVDAEAFRQTIDSLRDLADETLATARGIPQADFIYLLQARLALDGDLLWGRSLDRLEAGDSRGECPACKAEMYIVVGEYGCFVAAEEWVDRRSTPRVPIEPAAVSHLTGTARWLYDHAATAGHPVLAGWIRHLFGSTNCPACGAAIDAVDAIGTGV